MEIVRFAQFIFELVFLLLVGLPKLNAILHTILYLCLYHRKEGMSSTIGVYFLLTGICHPAFTEIGLHSLKSPLFP